MSVIENQKLTEMLDKHFEDPNAEDPLVESYLSGKLEEAANVHREVGRVVIPALEGSGGGRVVGYHTFYPVPSGAPFGSWGLRNQKAMKLLLKKE